MADTNTNEALVGADEEEYPVDPTKEFDCGEYDEAIVDEGYNVEGYASTWANDPSAGYVYDPTSGDYVYTGEDYNAVEGSYFALDSADPVSPFGDEAYWNQDGEIAPAPIADEGYAVEKEVIVSVEVATLETPVETATTAGGETTTPETPSLPQSKRKKKNKTKQERVQLRQAQLEQAETEKEIVTESPAGALTTSTSLLTKRMAEGRPSTFLDRERAKVRLRLRQLRAIRRKRMPVQVRILTATRTHLSPMETYFGGSVEAVMSDVFWASRNGDLRRVRFLVEVEKVSVTDSTFDPWHMEQTPLHWAAKGGDVAVIEYLLASGANPRSLDENGSLPLHLACWAGHVDATIALLRATTTKDLYVRDYDAALAPLDWAQIRGHTALVKAIERYEDAQWLPKFVDDLVRGIIRYKIKLYKDLPKSPTRFQFRRAGTQKLNDAATAPNNQQADETTSKPTEGNEGTPSPNGKAIATPEQAK